MTEPMYVLTGEFRSPEPDEWVVWDLNIGGIGPTQAEPCHTRKGWILRRIEHQDIEYRVRDEDVREWIRREPGMAGDLTMNLYRNCFEAVPPRDDEDFTRIPTGLLLSFLDDTSDKNLRKLIEILLPEPSLRDEIEKRVLETSSESAPRVAKSIIDILKRRGIDVEEKS